MTLFNYILTFVLVSFLLVGCANPNNHNNFSISLGDKEDQCEIKDENLQKGNPKANSPHLWKWMDRIHKKRA